MVHVDGDFRTGQGSCKFHCSPSCHPAQIGLKWVYGCQHKAWPQNRARDFVPIVECGGEFDKCELRKHTKVVSYYLRGLHTRIENKHEQLAKLKKELEDLTRCLA